MIWAQRENQRKTKKTFDKHIIIIILRWSLALSPRLECSGTTTAHCNLDLLDSSNPSTSASQVTGTTGMCHHAQGLLNFFAAIGSCCVAQAGLRLLTSSDLSVLASRVEMTGVSHCVQLKIDP